MKTCVSEYDFTEWFRINRPDNFTYTGLRALYEYLLQYEDDCGEEIEFDPIAICCEFSEYADLKEFQDDYGVDDYPDMESIQYQTMVIQADHYVPAGETSKESFIIQDF